MDYLRRLTRAVVRVSGFLNDPGLPAVLHALGAVRPGVFAEMIRAHELLATHRTFEALLPGVRA